LSAAALEVQSELESRTELSERLERARAAVRADELKSIFG
jgi:hypothetical protein